MNDSKCYPSVGTNSSPYYIPFSEQPEVTRTDQGYLSVQIFGAQAAFSGPWWQGAQNLSIVSQVNLHLSDTYDLANQDVRSIIQTRQISKDNAVQLGFSPLLVDFIPAKMKKLSISVEYLVNTKNYLRDLVGLISDKSLLSTISFTPGASMVAKTLSNLSEKILASFVPAEERKPILQFSGDFELVNEGVKEGYYVILGSHHERNPLPTGNLQLEVVEGGKLKNYGDEVTQLSYVILKVGCIKAIRDRFKGQGEWRNKLRELRQVTLDYTESPFENEERNSIKEFWEKTCLPKLREAQALLKADPNFLDEEIDLIYRSAYKECLTTINSKVNVRSSSLDSHEAQFSPDPQVDKAMLGIDPKENLDQKLNKYADQLRQAQKVFKEFK